MAKKIIGEEDYIIRWWMMRNNVRILYRHATSLPEKLITHARLLVV